MSDSLVAIVKRWQKILDALMPIAVEVDAPRMEQLEGIVAEAIHNLFRRFGHEAGEIPLNESICLHHPDRPGIYLEIRMTVSVEQNELDYS